MTRHVWDKARRTWVPAADRGVSRPSFPMVMADIPEYRSPLGTGTITSRSHRREDLKRGNCREVDPSEFKPKYINPRFARKHGLPFDRED